MDRPDQLAEEPSSQAPRSARWRHLPEGLASAAVLLVVVGSAGWWWSGRAPPAEVPAQIVESSQPLADAQEPAPAPPDPADPRERRRAEQEALIGTRADLTVDWLDPAGAVAMEAEERIVVYVEPWCPHCEEGLQTVLDVAAEEPGLSVVVVSALTRGATEAQLEDLLDAVDGDFVAGIIEEDTAGELFQKSSPRALVLGRGEVEWVGHPKRLAAWLEDADASD